LNPEVYLSRITQQYPKFWRDFEMLIAKRGRELPKWPDWCYCPMAGAYAVVSRGEQLPLEQAPAVAAMAALAAWRRTKGIYRFDDTLLDEIWATPVRGDLPIEILHRLPEWCVYIDLANQGRPMAGFFAHLEWDVGKEREELRLLIDEDGDKALAVPLHLGAGGIEKSLEAAANAATKQAIDFGCEDQVVSDIARLREAAPMIEPLVSLVLYLCAANADVTRRSRAKEPPVTKRSKPNKKEAGASVTTHWDVGVRVGAALRASIEARRDEGTDGGTHASPRAHVRRAHWHTYWTGPRTASTALLKWLSPILVGAEDELVPTVRDVS
jgi:hypothetical protein